MTWWPSEVDRTLKFSYPLTRIRAVFFGIILFFWLICFLFMYNRIGWLGVKDQVTYSCSCPCSPLPTPFSHYFRTSIYDAQRISPTFTVVVTWPQAYGTCLRDTEPLLVIRTLPCLCLVFLFDAWDTHASVAAFHPMMLQKNVDENDKKVPRDEPKLYWRSNSFYTYSIWIREVALTAETRL